MIQWVWSTNKVFAKTSPLQCPSFSVSISVLVPQPMNRKQESKENAEPLLPRFKNFPILTVVPAGPRGVIDWLLDLSNIPTKHTFTKGSRVVNIVFFLFFLCFATALTIIPLIFDIVNKEFILISFFYWVICLSRVLLFIKFHTKPGYPLCTNMDTSNTPPDILSILNTNTCEKHSFIKLGKYLKYYSIYSILYFLFHTIYYGVYLSLSNASFEMTTFAILGYALYFNQTGMFVYVCFFLVKFESRLKHLRNQLMDEDDAKNSGKTGKSSININNSGNNDIIISGKAPQVAKIGGINDSSTANTSTSSTIIPATNKNSKVIQNSNVKLKVDVAIGGSKFNKLKNENENKKDYGMVAVIKELKNIGNIILKYKYLQQEWNNTWDYMSLKSSVWQLSIALFCFEALVLIWLYIRALIGSDTDALFLVYGIVALSAVGVPALIFVHFGHRLTMAYHKMTEQVLNKIQDFDDMSQIGIRINVSGINDVDDNRMQIKNVINGISDNDGIFSLQKFRFYTILRNEMIENPLKCTMFDYEVSHKNFAISMATYAVVTMITQIISYVTSDW